MVSRREADISRSSRLECPDPFPCIEVVRIESTCGFGIFRLVNPLVLHEPFALCEQAVKSPMQEDAEARVAEVLPCFEVFGCGYIGVGVGRGLCRRKSCGGG